MMDASRGTGTPSSVLGLMDTINNNNTSRRPTTQSHESVQGCHDIRPADTTLHTVTGNKKAKRRLSGTLAAPLSRFALIFILALALAPPSSVQASTSSSSSSSRQSMSCLQVTDTALHSSCASGGTKAASFTFTMEGTATGTTTTVNTVSSCVWVGAACTVW